MPNSDASSFKALGCSSPSPLNLSSYRRDYPRNRRAGGGQPTCFGGDILFCRLLNKGYQVKVFQISLMLSVSSKSL